MKICCRLKTNDQLNTDRYEKGLIEYSFIPIPKMVLSFTFSNSATNHKHLTEKYKVHQRIICEPLFNGEYFGKTKPHFICLLTPLKESTYPTLFLTGYFCNGNPDEREQRKKENEYYVKSHIGENRIMRVLSFLPSLDDLIEFSGAYYKLEKIENEENKTTLFIEEKSSLDYLPTINQ